MLTAKQELVWPEGRVLLPTVSSKGVVLVEGNPFRHVPPSDTKA